MPFPLFFGALLDRRRTTSSQHRTTHDDGASVLLSRSSRDAARSPPSFFYASKGHFFLSNQRLPRGGVRQMATSKRKQKQAVRQGMTDSQPEIDYVAPDPNTRITWPRHLAGGVDDRAFSVIWPNNINSKKFISQGRRISVEHACEDPIVQEMSEVCQYLNLTHVIEPYKSLPRDVAAYPGRIRVQLALDGDGGRVNIESRIALMRKMGELIPKLNIRKHRIAMEQRDLDAQKQQFDLASGTKMNSKKKGKRGRR